jgi:hypothetical protein
LARCPSEDHPRAIHWKSLMPPQWFQLPDREKQAYWVAYAFLSGRLAQRSTIEWAVKLNSKQVAERGAILDLLNAPRQPRLQKTRLEAWQWIQEAWRTEPESSGISSEGYELGQRITGGSRSLDLVAAIVELVRPYVVTSEPRVLHLASVKRPDRRMARDLVHVQITSGKLLDPDVLHLDTVGDADFLLQLALALDVAVAQGLYIGRRLGWRGEPNSYRLGNLNRVYLTVSGGDFANGHEPDRFYKGIAPSVKLLHSVVSNLAAVNVESAKGLIKGWQSSDPIHARLWAAFARDRRLASPSDVFKFLVSRNDREFWRLYDCPEVAELRACRFAELDTEQRDAIAHRVLKLPPSNLWGGNRDRAAIAKWKRSCAIREMRRIELAGGILPERVKKWLTSNLREFPDLERMSTPEEGFSRGAEARFVPPNPDSRYDSIEGTKRLATLEAALTNRSPVWISDEADRAEDWMGEAGRAKLLVSDFEVTRDAGAAYPTVWKHFGWTYFVTSNQGGNNTECEDQSQENGRRVLCLLETLPAETIEKAIDGITTWFSNWQTLIADSPSLVSVWNKVWPIAVQATNKQQEADATPDLSFVAQATNDNEPAVLDAARTPVGKLVGVLLAACRSRSPVPNPFESNDSLRIMRDKAVKSPGLSGIVAQSLMIEEIEWFLFVDAEWTKNHLIAALLDLDLQSRGLWRAIGLRAHSRKALEIIGIPMAERANDPNLDRETRKSLAWSLAVDCLHGLLEGKESVVSHADLQQMLRRLDPEVRAYTAEVAQRFVRDQRKAKENQPDSPSAEQLFRNAVKPFLQLVWPPEHSLVTPGVAKAFADLPAVCGDAFAEAVETIKRFLAPFDCWSILDFGFFDQQDIDRPRLTEIDDREKANALIVLLDRSIGKTEGSRFPMDLGTALEQIRMVAPKLTEQPSFRRLAALTRR